MKLTKSAYGDVLRVLAGPGGRYEVMVQTFVEEIEEDLYECWFDVQRVSPTDPPSGAWVPASDQRGYGFLCAGSTADEALLLAGRKGAELAAWPESLLDYFFEEMRECETRQKFVCEVQPFFDVAVSLRGFRHHQRESGCEHDKVDHRVSEDGGWREEWCAGCGAELPGQPVTT